MKTKYPSQLMILLFLSSILTACESNQQKSNEAFEDYKEEKMLEKTNGTLPEDTTMKFTKINIESTTIKSKKRNEDVDEWVKFKSYIEKKIIKNEVQIKEIKEKKGLTAKEQKKANSLEKENNDLRRKIDEFKEDEKIQREKFKLNINDDINEISIELKDLSLSKTNI